MGRMYRLWKYVMNCSCCYEIEGEDDDIVYPRNCQL